ncbi:MAG: acyl carrier protein [Sphingomicrobium sp.]
MGKDEVLARIQQVVSEQLDDDNVVLDMNTVANAVNGWDSLAHVRIMIAVEEEFGIKFRMSDITSLDNVGDLVRLVDATLGS